MAMVEYISGVNWDVPRLVLVNCLFVGCRKSIHSVLDNLLLTVCSIQLINVEKIVYV